MLIEDNLPYLLADKEFYEPLERYSAADDFGSEVRRLLPATWTLKRRALWLHCDPPNVNLPPQGWKIHLSATLGNSLQILTTAARILVAESVSFKFVADRTILLLTNSKRWQRGGAGKFITCYPVDQTQCGELLACLAKSLTGYSGPYILSDRRFRNSQIVHYRYGGILPTKRMGIDGRPVPVIQLSGEFMDDERTPYFRLPDAVSDPFATDEPTPDGEAGTLKNGRYVVERVVAFSNPGGVYIALDRESERKVIIKEARPFTNVSPRGTDAVWLLKKEQRILELLEDTGVAPKPLDFFQDWEHYYLVEELIDGQILRSYHTSISLSLKPHPSRDQAEEFFTRFRALYKRIAQALQVLHEKRIVFSDLSHYNVMVLNDGQTIRLIDFEGAYEQGVDPPPLLFTPGFAPSQMLEEGIALPADDRFALGSLMLAALLPINSLLTLEPRAHERFLDALGQDLGAPPCLGRVIHDLLAQERGMRPSLPHVIAVLESEEPVGRPEITTTEADQEDLVELQSRILEYIDSCADYNRDDRLFPGDPAVFDTNPLSVGYGACGVAYVMHRITGGVRPEILEWILRQPLRPETYAPGLYVGLAGIAWALLELGCKRRAVEVLEMTHGHHLLWRSPDLFHGAAGWGMAQLRFFLATGDERYLDAAREVGDYLVRSRAEEPGTCWWPTQGSVSCGLGHGASGVVLFLLYLYQAIHDERLIDVARAGLEFVRSRALRDVVAGGVSWRIKEGEPSYTPYWRWGSAGIGLVLLRWLHVFDEPNYASLLQELVVDAERKYSIFPGYFFGLAGMGEFHLDRASLAQGAEREKALRAARMALSGCLLFRLERKRGTAFPGEDRSRISCDFGTGGAGIAHFVYRLQTGAGPAFLLDDLLPFPQRARLSRTADTT